MSLFVSPLDMSSLDYVPPTKADVVVRVRDDLGNPISGENIILTLDYTEDPTTWNASPYLASYSRTTNSNGEVKTAFIPGSFNAGTSTKGSCVLTANWTSNPSYPLKTVTLTWSNKPYLNVYTNISSETVKVGEFIDVTLRIAINGLPKINHDLTVMLDQDVSASMGNKDNKTAHPQKDRIDVATDAATVFINNLNESRTQMGLESYGKAQNPPEIGHMPIPSAFSLLKTNLALLDAQGGGSSQDMESTIYTSLQKIYDATRDPPHNDDLKVLILLSDGGQNFDAIGTSNIAKTNNTFVFTILYSDGVSNTSLAQGKLEDLARLTGGKFYKSGSEEELMNTYTDIYNQIAILAGDSTTMGVSFNGIVINKTYTAAHGSEVYDYIPVDIPAGLPVGNMSAPSATVNSLARTSIIWPNKTQSIQNQSEQWPNLTFTVGAIALNYDWSTTFRLKAKLPGCYNLFGPGSKIDLGDGSLPLILPDTPFCVNTTVNNTGVKPGTLNVTEFNTSSSGPFTEFVPLQWNTYYNSTVSTNKATEYVYYKRNGGPWVQFNVKSADPGDSSQSTSLDIRKLPWGIYSFWVHSTAVDANEDNDYINEMQVGIENRSYIKLQ
jgi:hypothetical protein